jgi:hypothetical protein
LVKPFRVTVDFNHPQSALHGLVEQWNKWIQRPTDSGWSTKRAVFVGNFVDFMYAEDLVLVTEASSAKSQRHGLETVPWEQMTMETCPLSFSQP